MLWRGGCGRPFFLLDRGRSLVGKYGSFVSAVVLWLAAATALAKDGYAELEVFSYSQAVPVDAAIHEWRGSAFRDGTVALLLSRAEAGVQDGRWRLGLLTRVDYQLRFSRDAAEFYHRISNRLPLEPGREYVVAVNAYYVFANGVRAGYLLQDRPDFGLELGVSLLSGQRLTDGRLNAIATAVAPNDYEFNLAVDYFYSRDVLFQRENPAPTGKGISTDVRLLWRPGPDVLAHVVITDLWGRMYWHDAPYTHATGTSATKEYDDQGYVRFKPLISGVEGNNDYTQSLPPRLQLALQYHLSAQYSALGEVLYTKVETFSALGLAYTSPQGVEWQGLYDFTTQGVTLRGIAATWSAGVGLDSLDLDRARTIKLMLQWRHRF